MFSSIVYLFIRNITHYFGSYRQLSTAVPSHLWSALGQFVPENVLPRNLLLSDIMTNWIDTAGYPLVTVTANGDDVHLAQVGYQIIFSLNIMEIFFCN